MGFRMLHEEDNLEPIPLYVKHFNIKEVFHFHRGSSTLSVRNHNAGTNAQDDAQGKQDHQ